MRLIQLGTLATIAACSASMPRPVHWRGTSIPTTPGPTCVAARPTLDLNADDTVVFAPDGGTWLLTGRLTTPGAVAAFASRPGADKRPYITRFDAKLTSDSIIGTYKTPRCTFDIRLTPST